MVGPKTSAEVPLPTATRERWQPIRGGLLNLYRYDYQEFRYEDGRLLLRGNNGTGKSRVLALQLPFLLDGEIIPQRVEPDQDPAKRMEWNLLLGDKHDDRLGYTWIEFGRVTEQGPQYKTLGCALRAVQGRGIAQQWFFITSQRIGRDLFLENEARQPLSKTKLEGFIGDKGRVFGSGKVEDDRREYRNVVDKELFGLGERYDALLSLLIQLRQPQLSRTLNEERLSNALSQALPPLPEAVLADVAEAFRSLDADRQELEDFKAARDSADLFLKEYQRYIQIAARRRAEEVRKSNSAYEATMRRLRAAEQNFETATRELHELAEQMGEIVIEEEGGMSVESTLRESPEMKDAKALDEARVKAEEARAFVNKAIEEKEHAAAAFEKEQHQHQLATRKLQGFSKTAQEHLAGALENAQTAGLEKRHREAIDRLGMPAPDVTKVDAVAAAQRELLKRRLEAVKHLTKVNQQLDLSRQQLAAAQQGFSQAEGHLNETVETERGAVATLEKETATLFDSYQAWTARVVEVSVPDRGDLEPAFADWREAPTGDSPLVAMLKDAERTASHSLEAQRIETEARLRQAGEELDDVQAEFNRLRDGYHEPPPVPYTRDANLRTGRTGAPLWALCDFLPSVREEERANLEAALEGSGLLDAWITPDGRLLAKDEQDTILAVGTSEAAVKGRGLDTALTPSIDPQDEHASAVSEATVRSVLRHIGLGRGAAMAWVDLSGQWQLGPLHGAWRKPAAQHIGHASREAARRRRMAELEQLIAAASEKVRRIKAELEALAQRAARLHGEIIEAPNDGDVRRALAQVDAIRGMVAALRQRLTEEEARVAEARQQLVKVIQERDQTAADLGITEWVDKLTDLSEAIHAYGQSLAELWPAIRAESEAKSQLALATQRVIEATQTQESRTAEVIEAKAKATAADEKFKTLESTVGAAVREVQQRLEAASKALAAIRAKKGAIEKLQSDKKVEQAVAQTKINETKHELQGKDTERNMAITGLVAFVGTRQLSVAHTDFLELDPGPWSVARAVDLARRVESALHGVDHGDEAWNRNQREIHGHFERLQSSLRSHGYMPEASMTDGLFVVSIQFQGRSCTITELRDNVVIIIQERQQLLDSREREVLENYLIDEVAEHLHDLLHRALNWKEEINAELAERPMSTGMMLRFIWEPVADLPSSFVAARRLLLGARGTWSPSERVAVGEFLQQQIKAVRASNDTGTWQDHLRQAFDYRKWHQFGVERKQDGVWKRLTRRTHGTGSGGEKAVALTLPQLAAAAAHYRSADKTAPRLILLDEVFVGVDKNMRAKCMDLLRVFDLDVVMTSESEWGCYPTVPAIAIYQLSARDGVDAIYAARWVWNGKCRVRDDSPLPDPRPPLGDESAHVMELS